MLIKLRAYYSGPGDKDPKASVWVNSNYIMSMNTHKKIIHGVDNTITKLQISESDNIWVWETPEEILKLINNAKA